MPLTFDFSEPSGQGNLGPVSPLKSLVTTLTGFQAFFDSSDAAESSPGSGKVAAWAASAGTGVLAQAASARYPALTTRDGKQVIGMNADSALALSGLTIGDVASFTFGLRFYQKTYTTDAQVLFGQDLSVPVYRLTSRYSAGNHFYRFDSDIDGDAEVAEANAWHTLVLCQGGGQAKLSVDGGVFSTVARATTLLSSGFFLGNGRDTAGSARIDVAGLVLCNADLSGDSTNLALLRSVLNAV